MKKIHRSNLIILLLCVMALAATAIAKYGLGREGKAALLCLGIGGVCAIASYFSKLPDRIKALGMLLSCSVCAMAYSWVVGGSSAAFVALFMTLGMSSIYFDKALIMGYAIPMSLLLLILSVVNPLVIEGAGEASLKGAIIKTVLFMLTSAVLYAAAQRGTGLILAATEMRAKSDALSEKLASSLNSSIQDVHKVNRGTENVTALASQIKNGMNNLNDSTLEVSRLVEDAANAIEENHSLSQELDEKFRQMNQVVSDGGDNADSFKNTLSEMMQTVQDTIKATEVLQQEMNSIHQILGTIGSISSKTQLLSLNASVEAARAGESGKGFAVVAGEIRSLSEQSAKSTEDIGEILDTLDERVRLVSERINAVTGSAQEGMDKMEAFITLFSRLNDNTHAVSEIVSRQYAIIDRVTQNFNRINDQVQSLVNVAEENNKNVLHITGNLEDQSRSIRNITEDLDQLNAFAAASQEENGGDQE